MKLTRLPAMLAATAVVALAAAPRLTRAALEAMEISFDKRIRTISVDAPFELLGNTRGVYLEGYGAVFTAEVNLAQSTNLSPFQLTIPKDYVAKLHARKMERVPVLRKQMKDAMLAMAASLDAVPPNEKIVLGVTLFYYTKWEDTAGLPSQIVMQAERQKLLDVQLGRTSRSELDSIIRVKEL
ncbi:MAG TPA: hypothetical protein VJN43_15365 [Bryobacteraceae bacterium]|nr:hypothetical protein [Bryobacteraceae bacterium]